MRQKNQWKRRTDNRNNTIWIEKKQMEKTNYLKDQNERTETPKAKYVQNILVHIQVIQVPDIQEGRTKIYSEQ